ncbi:MAG: ABC transporter permease [Desulfosarcinaceae bacterium]|nr:ABC transporter permease [Desulfosarcinaceae bacterium]
MTQSMQTILNGLRLFRWFTLRHLRRRLLRTLAVLVGIALGAAVFTSVRLAVQATLTAYSNSMAHITGTSDLSVVRPGGRVPDGLVVDLLRHPAVQSASPLLSAYVRPAHQETPFLLLGLDPVLDRNLRRWRLRDPQAGPSADWSALMTHPYTMVIGDGLAEHFGWQPGQATPLIHGQRTAEFRVIDILAADGVALVEGGRIAVCDIATFQEFTGLHGQADWIDLRLNGTASPESATEIAARLPPGIQLRSPTARSESGRGMIRAYQLSLTFLSFISLFVGMFLVYSLVALNAAARRRELAVMRASGASGNLLFALFVGEGAVIGLVGWLLALPISGLLVKHLLAAVSGTVSMLFVQVQVDGLTLDTWEVLLSFGVTVAVAMLAAVQPAREAMAVSPREAMAISTAASFRPALFRRLAIGGGFLLVLVYPVSQLPSPPSLSLSGYLAALLLFVGVALLAPLLLRHFGRLLKRRLQRLGGQPAALAADYLRSSGVQTAISIGALITAVALFTALVIMVHSFRTTTILWVEQSIAGDLYVRPKLAELNRFRDPLPPQVVAKLISVTDLVDLVPMRRLELDLKGHTHLFEAMDYADYTVRNRFIWLDGDPSRIAKAFQRGQGVVVSEVFANRTGLGVGDPYRIQIGDQQLDEPILGIFRDYRTRGGAVYYALTRYQERFDDVSWSGVQINVAADAENPAAVMDRIRTDLITCCGAALEMIDGRNLRRAIVQIFDETFAITTVLLLIALMVAAIGIATTLAVLVLQRRRQLNTLLAMGGSARQLRSMIFWEAGLIALVGQMAGLASGGVLSLLLIFVVNRQSFGWTFLYRVDWTTLLLAMPLIFAAALLAALPAVKLALDSAPAALLRGGTP